MSRQRLPRTFGQGIWSTIGRRSNHPFVVTPGAMSIVWYQNGCSSTARCMSAAVLTTASSSITLVRLDTDTRRTYLPGLPHRECRLAHRHTPPVLLARDTTVGRTER